MYVLYLDESGNPDNPADRHFVLGGAAVFEQTTFFLSRDFDNLQRKHWPSSQPIEFHASPIRSGKGFWRNVQAAEREAVLDELGVLIKNSNKNGVVLFAAVVEKDAKVYGEDAVKLATEQVVKRFDTFLTRCYQEHNNSQRGLSFSPIATTRNVQSCGSMDFAVSARNGVCSTISRTCRTSPPLARIACCKRRTTSPTPCFHCMKSAIQGSCSTLCRALIRRAA